LNSSLLAAAASTMACLGIDVRLRQHAHLGSIDITHAMIRVALPWRIPSEPPVHGPGDIAILHLHFRIASPRNWRTASITW